MYDIYIIPVLVEGTTNEYKIYGRMLGRKVWGDNMKKKYITIKMERFPIRLLLLQKEQK